MLGGNYYGSVEYGSIRSDIIRRIFKAVGERILMFTRNYRIRL